ncbi:MAG: iron ABC transporter permease [Actinomycetota bacterium]|nr:MAG: iron ABC transporter permease [Actinomycetota bacterium]
MALVACLVVALGIAVIVAVSLGQLSVPPAQVVGSLLHHLGLDWGPLPAHPQGEAALWEVRFPRVVMALLVGLSLGAAGAVMQGVFGNPLAEPAVIGVSSGAAVGACLVIVMGWTVLGAYTTAVAAFVAGLVTTFVMYTLARSDNRTEVVTLVLMGIAVNAVAAAAIAFLVFIGDQAAREQIVFWQLGSFNGARWESVAVVAPLVCVGLIGTVLIARQLDLLSLGERAARHLGLHIERLRIVAIVLVALLVAAGVAFVGIIAFVGLVVPHVIRMVIGPAHRALIPASALAGALVLVVADLVARTAVAYADLPIGMLTALVGGPFFFWLLRRTRDRAGGWA